MQVKFNKVIIEGFQSIGHIELDLCDRGFTIVSGVNNCKDDNAQNNGSGKTSMLNSIVFAICGETIQGVSKNLVNINTNTGLMVDLFFQADGVNYEILRTKEHHKYGTSLKLFENGTDVSGKGIRDTEKMISERLPDLTSELLGSVIIIGQGMPQKFTGNTPSGRKEVLEKLSKSDFMIEDIKNRLAARKSSLSQQSRDLELKLTSAESQKRVYEQQLSQFQNQLDSLIAPDPQEP